MPSDDTYADFVEHPRYGRGPRFTAVVLKEPRVGYRLRPYCSDGLIAGTALEADLQRQTSCPVPLLYYHDLRRTCTDCDRPFIFFAAEQKYWYEEIGFTLDSDCRQCVPCRKTRQEHARRRERYEELLHRSSQTAAENLELAECCLAMIEAGDFSPRKTQRVRQMLNRVRPGADAEIQLKVQALRTRLGAVEQAAQRGSW